ncbi:MAG: hypothetical protein ACI4KG_07685 [Oscillospiraceae bacterium]
MDIFYFILFAAVGLFNILAAVLDFKWYIDYWSYRNGMPRPRLKNRNVLRFLIGAAGVLLIAFGTAVLADLI